jgi:tRNA pseudouridine38-40 synthase
VTDPSLEALLATSENGRRIALGLEYDGSCHCGWQSQPNGQSIQDALQTALGQLAGVAVPVIAAGRTDAGVHALGQVVHFDAPVDRPITAWVRGTNRFLPNSIRVLWAAPVAPGFHARFSASSRSYTYALIATRIEPAVLRHAAGWTHYTLDVERMDQAISLLLGTHDFSSFRAAQCQAKTPIKTLYQARVEKVGAIIRIDVRADAFLHHMVRNIVGALVWIGQGKRDVQWMAELLAQCDRSRAAPTFMPNGLYLTGVGYPAEFALPSEVRAPLGLPLPATG